MYRMFTFSINEIKESALSSIGEGDDIACYELSGTFVPRMVDNKPAQVRDGADLDWLTRGPKKISS